MASKQNTAHFYRKTGRHFRIFGVISGISVLCMALVACGSAGGEVPSWEGEDLVKAAQEAYAALDSGQLKVESADGGELRVFTFYYDEKDVMHYCYQSNEDVNEAGEPSVYYEYNDGSALTVYKDGVATDYKWPSGVFEKYTRKNPNPNATSAIWFFEPRYIGSAKVTQDAVTGETEVRYDYDKETLSSTWKLDDTKGSIQDFYTIFRFDADGGLVDLMEYSSIRPAEGEDLIEASYVLSVDLRNQVTEIPLPEEIQQYRQQVANGQP